MYSKWSGKSGKHISALAIIALIANALLFVVHSSAMTKAHLLASHPDNRQVVICTPEGLKLITVNEQGDIVEETDAGHATFKCSTCASSSGLFADIPVGFILREASRWQNHDLSLCTFINDQKVYGQRHIRAPPV